MAASSDEVGSSRITRRAGVSVSVKARAFSTICRSVSVRSETGEPGAMRWPGNSSSSARPISDAARARQPQPRRPGCDRRAFSATVRLGQSDSSCETARMPSRRAAAAV